MTRLTDEALDVQLQMYTMHDRNVRLQRFYQHMIDAQITDYGNNKQNMHSGRDGLSLMQAQRVTLGLGETFAVTSEMVDVVERATRSMPSYKLNAIDVPCPNGFAYFEKAIVFSDVKNKPIALKAISWMPAKRGKEFAWDRESVGLDAEKWYESAPGAGIWITLWTDPHDPRDQMYSEAHKHPGEIDPIVYISDSMWDFGEDFDSVIKDTADYLSNNSKTRDDWEGYIETNPLRTLATFWRLVQEPFIDTRRERPTRGVARRMDRENLHIPDDGIRVITLRRSMPSSNKQGEERDEPWYQYQFVVRGHWRMQWYPSQQRHAPKWIAPFWKGPEHAPIIEHDHVFNFKR